MLRGKGKRKAIAGGRQSNKPKFPVDFFEHCQPLPFNDIEVIADSSYMGTCTVEPLIKDTMNKGHLCIKDTLNKGHLYIKDTFRYTNLYSGNTLLPLKEEDSLSTQ